MPVPDLMTESILHFLLEVLEIIFTCRVVRWFCIGIALMVAFFYRASIIQDEVISRWVLIGFGIWVIFESALAAYDIFNGERGKDFWLSAP